MKKSSGEAIIRRDNMFVVVLKNCEVVNFSSKCFFEIEHAKYKSYEKITKITVKNDKGIAIGEFDGSIVKGYYFS